jgi:hypothetical protein
MSKPWLYVIISLFAITVFFFSNNYLNGYLRCDSCLGKEIQAAPDSLYQYKLSNKAPFKYRLLFPTIVKTTHSIVFGSTDNIGFYYTYKFWSLFFYTVSSCFLFYLMTIAGFNNGLSFLGAIIFVLLPPMLMAYTLPVHTREDPLGYTILISGLICIVKEKRWLFLVVAIAGALCRETLLLLPMLYFFFGGETNIIRRLFISGVPVLTWLALRVFMGHEKYDVTEGFRWNNNNFEQVIGFLFVTFNFCWIAFLFFVLRYKHKVKSPTNRVRSFFFRSSLLTLFVILATTYLGGIYNEIRLLYLVAPWMILITLDFFELHSKEIRSMLFKNGYLAFVAITVLLCGVLMYVVLKHQATLIVPGKFNVPYHLWIIISVVYICITIIFVPVLFKVFSLKKTIDA